MKDMLLKSNHYMKIRSEKMIMIIVGALCMAYGIFCMIKGGTHVKNVGWRTKEEFPKSYYFNIISLTLLGASMIAMHFIKR